MSPALTGIFLTTGPPGKPHKSDVLEGRKVSTLCTKETVGYTRTEGTLVLGPGDRKTMARLLQVLISVCSSTKSGFPSLSDCHEASMSLYCTIKETLLFSNSYFRS